MGAVVGVVVGVVGGGGCSLFYFCLFLLFSFTAHPKT